MIFITITYKHVFHSINIYETLRYILVFSAHWIQIHSMNMLRSIYSLVFKITKWFLWLGSMTFTAIQENRGQNYLPVIKNTKEGSCYKNNTKSLTDTHKWIGKSSRYEELLNNIFDFILTELIWNWWQKNRYLNLEMY